MLYNKHSNLKILFFLLIQISEQIFAKKVFTVSICLLFQFVNHLIYRGKYLFLFLSLNKIINMIIVTRGVLMWVFWIRKFILLGYLLIVAFIKFLFFIKLFQLSKGWLSLNFKFLFFVVRNFAFKRSPSLSWPFFPNTKSVIYIFTVKITNLIWLILLIFFYNSKFQK